MLKIEDLKAGMVLRDRAGDTYDVQAVLERHYMVAGQWTIKGKLQPPCLCEMEDLAALGAEIQKPKLVRYVNVYSDIANYAPPKTVDEADAENDGGNRVARVRIEFEEGQFDD